MIRSRDTNSGTHLAMHCVRLDILFKYVAIGILFSVIVFLVDLICNCVSILWTMGFVSGINV